MYTVLLLFIVGLLLLLLYLLLDILDVSGFDLFQYVKPPLHGRLLHMYDQ
jgi:hypothetical protein